MAPRLRTVPFTERVPAWEVGRRTVLLALVLAAGYAALAWFAAAPSALGFALAAAGVAVAEVAWFASSPFPVWMLGRLGAGGPTRSLFRGVLVLVLLVREGAPPSWVLTAAGGLLGAHVLRAGGSALAEVCRIQRKMPVVTRGVPLDRLRLPAAPPPYLARRTTETLTLPDLLLAPAAATAVLAGGILPLAAGVGVAVGVLVAGNLALLRVVLAMRRVPRDRFVAEVSRAVDEIAPQVALYLGSGPDTLYQLETWVETLERLDRPAILLLRDRDSMARLGPSRLPVLCVEGGSVLMGMPLPTLRLVLYVSHGVNNLHMLRRGGVTHAFIGHGDSDKQASVNPFLKAYDEVWVSGTAAHQRFTSAGLGLAVRRIVEVGRPQLDGVAGAEPSAGGAPVGGPFTVLYAPTWEGYGDQAHETSLGPCGVELVRMLVAEGARVLYRPHPLAGTRDPAVARAHRQIVALLGNPSPPPAPEAPSRSARRGDDLDLAGDPPAMSRVEYSRATDAWAWDHVGAGAHDGPHRLVPGPEFSLRVCFAAADVLLADVSSVVSDFVATGKPYGVTNPARLPADDFVRLYPSAEGGYLLEPDGTGMAGLLAVARGGRDPLAGRRQVLRVRLHGPAHPPALDRLRAAVDRVLGTHEARASVVVPRAPAEQATDPGTVGAPPSIARR